ncbi:hypothetical protein ACP70R_017910 [Stipagrostis hirtigluma subsp. patula]
MAAPAAAGASGRPQLRFLDGDARLWPHHWRRRLPLRGGEASAGTSWAASTVAGATAMATAVLLWPPHGGELAHAEPPSQSVHE